MVARVRLVEHGEAVSVFLPVEIAPIDDDASNRGTVTANVLRCRVHDDRGTMLDGLAQDRASRIVHDERHTEFVSDLGDLRDREDRDWAASQRVRASVARRKFSGSAGSTKRHSIPVVPIVFWNRFQVPP